MFTTAKRSTTELCVGQMAYNISCLRARDAPAVFLKVWENQKGSARNAQVDNNIRGPTEDLCSIDWLRTR